MGPQLLGILEARAVKRSDLIPAPRNGNFEHDALGKKRPQLLLGYSFRARVLVVYPEDMDPESRP